MDNPKKSKFQGSKATEKMTITLEVKLKFTHAPPAYNPPPSQVSRKHWSEGVMAYGEWNSESARYVDYYLPQVREFFTKGGQSSLDSVGIDGEDADYLARLLSENHTSNESSVAPNAGEQFHYQNMGAILSWSEGDPNEDELEGLMMHLSELLLIRARKSLTRFFNDPNEDNLYECSLLYDRLSDICSADFMHMDPEYIETEIERGRQIVNAIRVRGEVDSDIFKQKGYESARGEDPVLEKVYKLLDVVLS